MAAYDNVQLPAPPNIAQAGNYAQMLMQGLSSLPEQYYKGQQAQYQQRQNNLFQNPDNKDLLIGAIQDAYGNSNYAQLLAKVAQAGGAPAAQGLLSQLQGAQGQRIGTEALNGGGGSSNTPVNTGPAASTSAASPASITGNTGQPRPTQVTQTNGGDSVNSLSIEKGVDLEPFLTKYPRVRTMLNRDLTPGEADTVGKLMTAYKGGGGQPTTNAQAPQRNPVAGAEDQSNPNITPSGVGGSSAVSPQTPGAGAPSSSGTVAGAPSPQQGAPSFQQRFSGIPTEQDIQAHEQRAQRLFTAALDPRVSKDRQETLQKAAAEEVNTARTMRQERFEASKPTDAMRAAAAAGYTNPLDYERAQESAKLKVKDFQELDKGIQAQDSAASDSDEDMRAMRGILNDPRLFTGPGNEAVQYLRGVLINAGLMDKDADLPQDALKKITSKAMQAQMAQMRDDAAQIGGSAGRIMLAQVRIMQDASQNPNMTKSGLRYLTELMERTNQRTHDLAQLATAYKRQHGGMLDDGFYPVRAHYFATHPLITDQEMEHHQLLSAPHLPASLTRPGTPRDAASAWARSQGLSPGDPIRVGNDYIKAP